MTTLIETMVARWSDPAARPLFRGSLIDDNGCCCAQGDVLRVCGWSDDRLRKAMQADADLSVAKSLGISVTHAVLLRHINDRHGGCPQDVLAHPERILGDQAPRVLAFWRRLDGLTDKQLAAIRVAGWYTTWDATADVAFHAAAYSAWATAGGVAAAATNEIQGAPLRYLLLFGINDPAELDVPQGETR